LSSRRRIRHVANPKRKLQMKTRSLIIAAAISGLMLGASAASVN
jgi:hypothetical protein